MKKYRIFAIIFIMSILFSACAGVTVTPSDTQIVVAKSAARIFGYKMMQANPSIAPAATHICTMLSTGDPTQAMIDAAVAAATEYFSGDPLMAATFLDLVSLVKIQPAGGNAAAYDPVFVVEAAKGCLEGIQMYQLQKLASAKH